MLCGKPRERAAHWASKAREFARLHNLEVKDVLDMHDHLACVLEWDGAPPAEAEWYAWEQLVDILTPKAVRVCPTT